MRTAAQAWAGIAGGILLVLLAAGARALRSAASPPPTPASVAATPAGVPASPPARGIAARALPTAAAAPRATLTDPLAGHLPPTLQDITALGSGTIVAVGDAGFSGGLDVCPNLGGIYCPSGGMVLVSHDGGHAWTRNSIAKGELLSVAATGTASAVAWGPYAIEATADGGTSWHAVRLPGPGQLGWLSFASPSDGWAGMQGGCTGPNLCSEALFATSDGGGAWTEIAVSGPYPVENPHAAHIPLQMWGGYLGGGHGWVGAAGNFERWTTDGGRTWALVSGANAVPALLSVAPAGGGDAWALANGPLQGSETASPTEILHTGDGWRTWSAVSTLPVVAARLRAAPGGTLWALGAPRPDLAGYADILTSTDGGRSWAVHPAAGLSLFAVAPTGTTSALAVAATPGGTFEVVSTGNGGRSWQAAHVPASTATPGPTIALGFWNARDGWGAGTPADLGAILVTRDGGRSWSREGTLPSFLTDAALADPVQGVAAGVPGAAGTGWLQTADGGRSWQPLPHAPSGSVLSFTLSSPALHTYAAALMAPGGGVEVALSKDGGAGWTTVAAPAAFDQLAFDSPSDGWAVSVPGPAAPPGSPSILWHTADGGSAWTEVTRLGSGPAWQGPLLAASGPDDVWLVSGDTAASGAAPVWRLWHTADGGRTWSVYTLPPPLADAYFGGDTLAARGAADAWLLTRTGLWRTGDGGAAWQRVAAP